MFTMHHVYLVCPGSRDHLSCVSSDRRIHKIEGQPFVKRPIFADDSAQAVMTGVESWSFTFCLYHCTHPSVHSPFFRFSAPVLFSKLFQSLSSCIFVLTDINFADIFGIFALHLHIFSAGVNANIILIKTGSSFIALMTLG